MSNLDLTQEGRNLSDQAEVVLQSETFRNSETLARLLRFLVDKTVKGESDKLNAYSVAIDALGKPGSFDPRLDSSVRFQIGRLRQKLAEYYNGEGHEDLREISVPKGSFRIESRERSPVALSAATENTGFPAQKSKFIAAIALLALCAIVSTAAYWRERQKTAVVRSAWTADLELLWQPYLTTHRPLILVIEEPLFVEFKGRGVYRELGLNRWPDITGTPRINAIQKALESPEIQPYHYYAPMGEVEGAFRLGEFLGSRIQAMSLVSSRALSWQQVANNNIIYLGIEPFISEKLKALPIDMEITNTTGGWRNLHPQPGEPSVFRDQIPEGPAEDGEVYALITRTPGPLGMGDVTLFFSKAAPGRLGAVNWFVSAAHAETLVSRMKDRSGHLPSYYQVLLRVKYKDEVPTEAEYVLFRQLRINKNAPSVVNQ